MIPPARILVRFPNLSKPMVDSFLIPAGQKTIYHVRPTFQHADFKLVEISDRDGLLEALLVLSCLEVLEQMLTEHAETMYVHSPAALVLGPFEQEGDHGRLHRKPV